MIVGIRIDPDIHLYVALAMVAALSFIGWRRSIKNILKYFIYSYLMSLLPFCILLLYEIFPPTELAKLGVGAFIYAVLHYSIWIHYGVFFSAALILVFMFVAARFRRPIYFILFAGFTSVYIYQRLNGSGSFSNDYIIIPLSHTLFMLCLFIPFYYLIEKRNDI